jgi:hypothetical protein
MWRFIQITVIFALLVSSAATSAAISPGGAAQGNLTGLKPAAQDPQPPGTQVFMPFVIHDPGYTVTGKVTDSAGQPVANVKVVDQSGRSVFTDAAGSYAMNNLPKQGALAPNKSGLVFSPSLAQLNLGGGNTPVNFNAFQQCPDFIVNGSFEVDQAWQQPITEYSAGYTTSAAHTGTRAMRTGITNANQNKYSYSSTRQPILIPAGTASATLRLWLYPMSSETSTLAMPSALTGPEADEEALGSDGQYVLVLNTLNDSGQEDPYNPNSGKLLETLLWTRSNNQQWSYYEFNLSRYADPDEDVWIKIQAGTYNDGVGGVTAMYVDDITLELCGAGAAPVPPTQPAQGACTNAFINSDFSLVDRGWSIPVTAFSARYSYTQSRSAPQSMRTGIVDSAKNIYSYSDAWQLATIPSNATSATLNMWIFPNSSQTMNGVQAADAEALAPQPLAGQRYGEQALATDMQYVLLLDQYGYILETLWWERWNYTNWMQLSFDLSDYAGRTVRIQFGTYNDGWDGITAMYVDDATLDVCTGGSVPGPTPTPAPTSTPAPTPIPGACNEGFVNNGFELDTAWGIPVTAFTAGYTTAAAHTGTRSMRNGITSSSHNRYSYSDAYQVSSIPLTVNTSTVGMWIYPISGEVGSQTMGDSPTAELLSTQASGNDVQYVLVLDQYGNWIDTLLWQRKNSQTWAYHTFDVSRWIGTTIRLQFGVYNDGWSGVTAMYVDDTTLQLCP